VRFDDEERNPSEVQVRVMAGNLFSISIVANGAARDGNAHQITCHTSKVANIKTRIRYLYLANLLGLTVSHSVWAACACCIQTHFGYWKLCPAKLRSCGNKPLERCLKNRSTVACIPLPDPIVPYRRPTSGSKVVISNYNVGPSFSDAGVEEVDDSDTSISSLIVLRRFALLRSPRYLLTCRLLIL
jgi:hypothetical protein